MEGLTGRENSDPVPGLLFGIYQAKKGITMKRTRELTLHRESLRILDESDLLEVNGGAMMTLWPCPTAWSKPAVFCDPTGDPSSKTAFSDCLACNNFD